MTRTRLVQAGLLALALASPWLGLPRVDTGLVTTVCLFAIAAAGLNLMFGYAGMLSLGNGLFLGAGAYTVALTTHRLGWPAGLGILAGVALTAAVAALIGVVLVRLSGHYFAVATLGLAAAFAALPLLWPDVTGGASGLTTARRLDLGPLAVTGDARWYALVVVVTAGMFLLFDRLVAGRRGRVLRLVRHDELAAAVLGVAVARVKLLAFVAGAAFAGVAGALLFLWQGLVVPDGAGVVASVQLAALVVVGGLGYRLGPLVGAFAVLWLQALLNGLGSYELLVYGAVFLAVMFFLRPGIEGAAVELWWRLRRRAPAAAPSAGPAPAAVRGRSLEVRGVARSFGGVAAVRDASLAVPAGSIVGLVGPNGAGKTTLLNLVSGVERLQAGAVLLDGAGVGGLSAAERTRRGIVRTFQVPRLVDELSVVENVALGPEAAQPGLLRRRRSLEVAALGRARAALADLALSELADRPAGGLGTGERKSVELARALATGGSVLLLDEPAVGLSLAEVDGLRRRLRALRAQGMAILVVDHNLDFVESLADDVYVMASGRVERGTAAGLAAEPAAWRAAPPLAGGPGLTVTDLSAGYGSVTVVHGVSFAAAGGEVLGIAGPNGAGKTTLLNAVAGLHRRCSGGVVLGGTPLSGASADRRVALGLALVPEGRQVIGSLTVRANLEVTLLARGRLRPDAEHRARLAGVFELFPRLEELQHAPGQTLSGGEQQMLAIGRALMTGPRALLLDEPSQGLAAPVVDVLIEALRRLRRSVTIVLVEQNPTMLEALADRVLTLRMGRLAA
ncbi:MAG: ATP-binding cassette domain-containing protein [Chloroflexi bacterium]|nr:MAG: ATP-binding cassette domain-containing protein [Chloroflexota bacterium]